MECDGQVPAELPDATELRDDLEFLNAGIHGALSQLTSFGLGVELPLPPVPDEQVRADRLSRTPGRCRMYNTRSIRQ